MLIFNLETCYTAEALAMPIPDDELNAGITSQWKDPDKIRGQQASNQKKWGETVKKLSSLDWRLGRIVAIGYQCQEDHAATIWTAEQYSEKDILGLFWEAIMTFGVRVEAERIAGFGIRFFDLPWLYGRSAVLGVKPTRGWHESRYSHHFIVDWADILSNYDPSRTKGWTLERYATWFQLPVERFGQGSQVPGWVEAGDWASIERHLRSGLEAVRLLGEKFKHLI